MKTFAPTMQMEKPMSSFQLSVRVIGLVLATTVVGGWSKIKSWFHPEPVGITGEWFDSMTVEEMKEFRYELQKCIWRKQASSGEFPTKEELDQDFKFIDG